jgi:hypothetical protein
LEGHGGTYQDKFITGYFYRQSLIVEYPQAMLADKKVL